MSSGKHDCGMFAVTEPYICKSCKVLADVVVGMYGVTFSKEEALREKGKSGFELDFYVCPHCKSDDHLVKWNKSKRPCPKCDGKMEKDLRDKVIMWD
jgi:hypothetical protein